MVLISTDLLTNHKKIVVTEINTLYPSLMISHKLGKLFTLLFSGDEEQMIWKSLVLLLKKEVVKKFKVLVELIMDNEAT